MRHAAHALLSVPVALILATSHSARACTCIHAPLEVQLRDAAVLFRGREVASIRIPSDPSDPWYGTGDQFVSTFEVYEAWRGVDTRTIAISTGTRGDTCAIAGSLGDRELVVMAWVPKRPGRLPRVGICSDPVPASSARDELDALGPGVRPDRPSARGWFGGDVAFALAALP